MFEAASTAVTRPLLGVHAKLLGMAVLWGASWPAGKVLAQSMPPLTAAAWRFAFAVLILLVWMLATRGWPRLSPRQWASLALAGAVGVFGYAVFFMLGLQLVPASRAALVVTTNPVFTTLLAVWLFREHFNGRIGLGMLMAVLGAATVLTRGAPWHLFAGALGLGEWLLLGCVATWTGYTLISRGLLKGIDTVTSTALGAVFGTALLIVTALLLDGRAALAAPLVWTPTVWISMAFLVVGATVLAYAWYFDGVAQLGAGTAASYISLVPVFGVSSSILLLGEPVDSSLLIGGALAVAGVVVMNRARR
ncbi:DMT family transporter [Piscinibacterium candidicorallinum]|uniref:DMT family transporter n=1 Tax=Piscinibacterium candidicorallinum TaxID=1793872 RepID=A0ABV7H3P0_9BURK